MQKGKKYPSIRTHSLFPWSLLYKEEGFIGGKPNPPVKPERLAGLHNGDLRQRREWEWWGSQTGWMLWKVFGMALRIGCRGRFQKAAVIYVEDIENGRDCE